MLYSQLRTAKRLNLAEAIPLPVPMTIYVEPTNVCNLACDFCPHSIPDYKEAAAYHQHMPLSLFSRLMNEIRDMRIKSLKLYFFGEPLMHPEIGEMCRLAANACERVELTTNAIPFTDAKIEAIANSGIHFIRLSWYGEKPERVRRNIRLLSEARNSKTPFLAIKVFNQKQAEEVEDLRPVVDEICIEQLHTVGSNFVQLRSYEENKKACPYPFYTMVVKANGDVVPCCVAWETSLNCGNVNDYSLHDIWNGPRMHEIRMAHLSGQKSMLHACASCDTIYNCPDSVDSVSPEEFERRIHGHELT